MKLITILVLLLLAAPGSAQEHEIRSASLPPDVEREILRLYAGGGARYDGPAQIGRADVIGHDVAAMGGPLRVAGRVEGNLAMVHGDVIIEPGGVVTGDVTVVGGEVRLENRGIVGGTITTYAAASRGRRAWDHDRPRGEWDRDRDRDREDGADIDDDADERRERRRRVRSDRGDARLTVRAGSSYNRVEGLPVMFGPVIRTAGSNPLRVEALAIWRSESGSDTDRMGYRVKAEQFFGDRRFSVGASLFSVVQPLDGWQISDLEASLAAVAFHDDYRDYHGRTGWGAFATVRPMAGLEATVEYRREEHDARAAGDPWSLFHGGEEWRRQPLVGEGDLHLLGASAELDLRDRRSDPREGWLARVSVERPVSGSLSRPAMFAVMSDPIPGGAEPDVPATELSTDFTSAQVDVRRYDRVGRRSQLNARVMAGGSLTGDALPAQYQHTLGGFGTLPGYPTFHADCGARTFAGMHDEEHYFPAYGCDRFALAQLEYRGSLSLDLGFGSPRYDDDRWDSRRDRRRSDRWDWQAVDFNPRWVAFLDAGRGWGTGRAVDVAGLDADRDTGTLVDVGLGFLIDDFGIYAALPLTGGVDQEPRFFVRLGRRF